MKSNPIPTPKQSLKIKKSQAESQPKDTTQPYCLTRKTLSKRDPNLLKENKKFNSNLKFFQTVKSFVLK